jgi:hypothetical protein
MTTMALKLKAVMTHRSDKPRRGRIGKEAVMMKIQTGTA